MPGTVRQIPFGKPLVGKEEKRAVADVLEGTVYVHGPKATEFEGAFANWTDSPHAVSVSSATAALHLTYFSAGIGPGDEVIVPAQTHVATAHAVELVGAKPIFVDAEIKTGNIHVEQIEERITPRTRAISLVHFLGMPVDMDGVNRIARKRDLLVVEDCALALGSYYKGIHAGLHGSVGCFSFYPVKHITTAEGGMLISKHSELIDKIKHQKAFGLDRTVSERKIPGIYDVNLLGMNYRLNEISAAIGIEQLKRLDSFLSIRRENARSLRKGLGGCKELSFFEDEGSDYKSSHYCFSVLLNGPYAAKRFDIVSYLNSHGVGTSIYYPHPVPRLAYYQNKYGYRGKEFPNAEKISDTSIALPVGPHLNGEDMNYIAQTMKEALCRV